MRGYTLDIAADGIATVVFDLPGKVNVMNDDFFTAMTAVLSTLEAEKARITGIILTSAKSTFFAGGDLKLMRDAKDGQQEFLFRHFEKLKHFFRRIERFAVPVVAAINGTALGGGYELCLACHRRIAVNNPKTAIGLPEVGFGILPAAGGVIRLTSLIGLRPALEYLLTGKKVDVQTALRAGLIDEVVETPEAMDAAARAWIRSNPHVEQPWDKPRELGAHRLSPAQRGEIFSAAAWMQKNGFTTDKAAVRIADIAAESMYLNFDVASRIETRGFVWLLLGDEARSKISAFFQKAA